MGFSTVKECFLSLMLILVSHSLLYAEDTCQDQFQAQDVSSSIQDEINKFFSLNDFWKVEDRKEEVKEFFDNIEHFFIGPRSVDDLYFMASNPMIRLESWYGKEDPEYNKRHIGPILFNEAYANIPQEYLFIIFCKTFYTKILQADAYKEPFEGYFPLRFYASDYNKNLKFNDKYSIKEYALNTWNYVKRKSIFETKDIDCIDQNTLTFIATYMLVSEYGVEGLDSSVDIESELIKLYKDLDYLNKIYVIIFLHKHGKSRFDSVQTILNNVEKHIAFHTYQDSIFAYGVEYSHRFYRMIHSLITRDKPKF